MTRAYWRRPLTRRKFLDLTACGVAGWLVGALSVPAIADGNPSLQHQVNSYIQKLRRAGNIPPDERTAWSVSDLTTGHKLVSINEDRPLQAASMIKPFLAQAYFFCHERDSHTYPYDELIRQKLEEMICKSDNEAANFFINRIAGDLPVNQRPHRVERVLKSHAGGIFRQTSIVEFIPTNGRTYRNMASALDYSRFLSAMFEDRLPFVNEIKYYMGLPKRNRIKDGAADVPQTVDLYDKSGSTAQVCGDMGVVVARNANGHPHCYTFIGIIQKDKRAADYGTWMRHRGNVIREVSGLVYTFMRKRYDLVG
ncbi:MAG: serine hydrolase [Deltaproteobacteria bacterium]|nr:serine hydrolase [Deltaproteobacteria bacterium]